MKLNQTVTITKDLNTYWRAVGAAACVACPKVGITGKVVGEPFINEDAIFNGEPVQTVAVEFDGDALGYERSDDYDNEVTLYVPMWALAAA